MQLAALDQEMEEDRKRQREKEEAEWEARIKQQRESFTATLDDIMGDMETSPSLSTPTYESPVVPVEDEHTKISRLLSGEDEGNTYAQQEDYSYWKEILSRPGVTVEAFLEEDRIVDVLKYKRYEYRELLDYFTDVDTITQLIQLITLPIEDGQDVTANAYALEILSSGIPEIDTKIVRTPSLLEGLFAFWKDFEVNHLLANAVAKVMKSVCTAKEKEFVYFMRTKNPDCVGDMIRHISAGGVLTFWGTFIRQNENGGKVGTQNLNWLASTGFIEKLLDTFTGSMFETHSNTADLLMEVIDSSTWESPLMQRLSSQQSCTRMFDYLFEAGNVSGSRYVPRVYNHLLAAYTRYIQEKPEKRLPLDTPLERLPPVIKEPTTAMADIILYLKTAPDEKLMMDRNRRQHRSFGFCRYGLLDMIDLVVSSEYYVVVDTLLYVNFFAVAMDLLFSFEHSTFCHRLVYAIFHFCLTTQPADIIMKVLTSSNIPMEVISLEQQNADLLAQGDSPLQIIPYARNLGFLLLGYVQSDVGSDIVSLITGTAGWDEYAEKLVALQAADEARRNALSNMEPSSGGLQSSVDFTQATVSSEGSSGIDYNPEEEGVNFEDIKGENLDDMLADLSGQEGSSSVDDIDKLLGGAPPEGEGLSLDDIIGDEVDGAGDGPSLDDILAGEAGEP
eukprot:TRINITY_DN1946_c2_g1_i1.p1 TRINITY_DN1946_c2_g1~~TRINITY_DN1946_c2_g1_i1.p1  ORF type:complete len:759 (+),score=215.69 TRINITY_DN1946_c2_g1_i1:256-2277(+)